MEKNWIPDPDKNPGGSATLMKMDLQHCGADIKIRTETWRDAARRAQDLQVPELPVGV
jgi:hypothetical protein